MSMLTRGGLLLTLIAITTCGIDSVTADLIQIDSVIDVVTSQNASDQFGTNHNGNDITAEDTNMFFKSRIQSSFNTTDSLDTFYSSSFADPAQSGADENTLMTGSSSIEFTVITDDVTYSSLFDNFRGTGQANSRLEYLLRDITNSGNIVDLVGGYEEWQDGVYDISSTGSTAGSLINGHQYQLASSWSMSNFNAMGGGGGQTVGTAQARLDFSTAQVPEPASLGILGMGAIGLISLRRRRLSS
ncbi:MAG: PEP-CTERM sorting domain-containing protein [Pirellulaceae bacterium]